MGYDVRLVVLLPDNSEKQIAALQTVLYLKLHHREYLTSSNFHDRMTLAPNHLSGVFLESFVARKSPLNLVRSETSDSVVHAILAQKALVLLILSKEADVSSCHDFWDLLTLSEL